MAVLFHPYWVHCHFNTTSEIDKKLTKNSVEQLPAYDEISYETNPISMKTYRHWSSVSRSIRHGELDFVTR